MDKKNFGFISLSRFLLATFFFASLNLTAQAPVVPQTKKLNLNAQDQEKSTITVNKMVHDFGKIKESDQTASTIFKLTNNSDSPLIIYTVHVSCGCTTPDWTKEPINPGKSGYVKATYNTPGRIGPFDKTITVESSGKPAMLELRIKGTVEKDK
ncbi:MAG: DUF1573 domain-containing protein [Dysgonamonadaceae bacterium]|nr:DUF1573 domain-containing protein [Dysgonamonadaceae bacterium]